MQLPQLENEFKALAESASKRDLKELKPRNPKFTIDEKLKFQINQVLIEKDTGNERNYINIKVKDSRYSPSLEDNIYTVIILDTTGQIEDYITEKDLIDRVKER